MDCRRSNVVVFGSISSVASNLSMPLPSKKLSNDDFTDDSAVSFT